MIKLKVTIQVEVELLGNEMALYNKVKSESRTKAGSDFENLDILMDLQNKSLRYVHCSESYEAVNGVTNEVKDLENVRVISLTLKANEQKS